MLRGTPAFYASTTCDRILALMRCLGTTAHHAIQVSHQVIYPLVKMAQLILHRCFCVRWEYAAQSSSSPKKLASEDRPVHESVCICGIRLGERNRAKSVLCRPRDIFGKSQVCSNSASPPLLQNLLLQSLRGHLGFQHSSHALLPSVFQCLNLALHALLL